MAEILATLDDINAQLADNVVEATGQNTELLQISVARVVRGYLSRVISGTTLATWTSPDKTPDIIREAAAMLIASQVFFQATSATSLDVDDRNWGQLLYDRAISLLTGVVDGDILIDEIVVEPIDSMSALDFFPTDDTDRAFTVGMEL